MAQKYVFNKGSFGGGNGGASSIAKLITGTDPKPLSRELKIGVAERVADNFVDDSMSEFGIDYDKPTQPQQPIVPTDGSQQKPLSSDPAENILRAISDDIQKNGILPRKIPSIVETVSSNQFLSSPSFLGGARPGASRLIALDAAAKPRQMPPTIDPITNRIPDFRSNVAESTGVATPVLPNARGTVLDEMPIAPETQARVDLMHRLDSLPSRVNKLDDELSIMKPNVDTTDQASVDEYNALVNERNSLFDDYKRGRKELDTLPEAAISAPPGLSYGPGITAAPPLNVMDKVREIASDPASTAVDLMPYLSSAPAIKDMTEATMAVYKLKKGIATQDDLKLLSRFEAKNNQDTTMMRGVFDILYQQPAFVGELITSMGAFNLGKNAALKVGKESIDWLVSKSGQKALGKALASKYGKFAGKVATNIAGGTLQAIPAGVGRIPTKAMELAMPEYMTKADGSGGIEGAIISEGESTPMAMTKAVADQWVEVVSEHSGKVFKEAAKLIPENDVTAAIANAIRKANPGIKSGAVNDIMEKAVYSGPLGEFGEERIGEIGRAVLGLEEYKFPTKKQIATELIAFTVPGAAAKLADKVIGGEPPADGGGGGDAPEIRNEKSRRLVAYLKNNPDATVEDAMKYAESGARNLPVEPDTSMEVEQASPAQQTIDDFAQETRDNPPESPVEAFYHDSGIANDNFGGAAFGELNEDQQAWVNNEFEQASVEAEEQSRSKSAEESAQVFESELEAERAAVNADGGYDALKERLAQEEARTAPRPGVPYKRNREVVSPEEVEDELYSGTARQSAKVFERAARENQIPEAMQALKDRLATEEASKKRRRRVETATGDEVARELLGPNPAEESAKAIEAELAAAERVNRSPVGAAGLKERLAMEERDDQKEQARLDAEIPIDEIYGDTADQKAEPTTEPPADEIVQPEPPVQAESDIETFGLKPQAIKFAQSKVDALDSVDAVNNKYFSMTPFDQYARAYAKSKFGKTEAKKAPKKINVDIDDKQNVAITEPAQDAAQQIPAKPEPKKTTKRKKKYEPIASGQRNTKDGSALIDPNAIDVLPAVAALRGINADIVDELGAKIGHTPKNSKKILEGGKIIKSKTGRPFASRERAMSFMDQNKLRGEVVTLEKGFGIKPQQNYDQAHHAYNDYVAEYDPSGQRVADFNELYDVAQQEILDWQNGRYTRDATGQWHRPDSEAQRNAELEAEERDFIDSLRGEGFSEKEIEQVREGGYGKDVIARIKGEIEGESQEEAKGELSDMADEETLTAEEYQAALDEWDNIVAGDKSDAPIKKPKTSKKFKADRTTAPFDMRDSRTGDTIKTGDVAYRLTDTGEMVSEKTYRGMTELGEQGALFGDTTATPTQKPKKVAAETKSPVKDIMDAPYSVQEEQQQNMFADLEGQEDLFSQKSQADSAPKTTKPTTESPTTKKPAQIAGNEVVDAFNKEHGFKISNPGGEWLENDLKKAKASTDKYGGYTGGSLTASYSRPVMLPTDKMVELDGESGEHNKIKNNDDRVNVLTESMKKNGYDAKKPILVIVGWDGKPRISEGNHRVRAALDAGIKNIPVEIRYFAGSEGKQGALSPDAVVKMSNIPTTEKFNIASVLEDIYSMGVSAYGKRKKAFVTELSAEMSVLGEIRNKELLTIRDMLKNNKITTDAAERLLKKHREKGLFELGGDINLEIPRGTTILKVNSATIKAIAGKLGIPTRVVTRAISQRNEGGILDSAQEAAASKTKKPAQIKPVQAEKAPAVNKRGLDDDTIAFINGNIKRLGSLDAVNKLYNDSAPVSKYARDAAPDILGVAPVAKTAKPTFAKKTVSKQAPTENTDEAKSMKRAQTLRKRAESLSKRATERLNQDRQTNTNRRARIAHGIQEEARRDIADAKTMENIADAIEDGTAGLLSNVSSSKDIDLFKQISYSAIRANNNGIPNRPFTEEDAGYAKIPTGQWYVDEKNRLKKLGITNRSDLIKAMKLFANMQADKQQEDPIKKAERKLVGQKIAGFFPTPKALIDNMLGKADIQPGMDVLEPSAGKGDIADAMKDSGANIDTAEISHTLRELLKAKGYKPHGDFMDIESDIGDKKYDRIVMNPPFEKMQDVDHVRKAYDLLHPGGRLVAIMGEGPFFNSNKKATAFREWFDDLGGISEKNEAGSFKTKEAFRQTGTSTRIVVIDKPRGDTQYSTRTRPSAAGITLADVKKMFPGRNVGQDKDGNFWFDDATGRVKILMVDEISPDEVSFEVAYKRKMRPNEKIAGSYVPGVITISKVGDKWTISHENYHHLEKSGIIRSGDIRALNSAINKANPGGVTQEQRARFVEKWLKARGETTGFVRKIIQRIKDMIDRLVNLHHRTARGVLRDIESGKVGGRDINHEAKVNSSMQAINEFAKSTKYSISKAMAAIKNNPKFTKWFGDSKVVDGKGDPLVVYHGSPDARFMDDTGVFKSYLNRFYEATSDTAIDKEQAFFFTPSQRAASTYADDTRAFDYQNAEPSVIPAYLSLSNPMIIDNEGKSWFGTQSAIKKAKEAGHDGVIIRNTIDDYQTTKKSKPIDVYVVFESTQIKSIYNTGEFDAGNPNINYSVKEVAPEPTQNERLNKKVAELKAGIPTRDKDEFERHKMSTMIKYRIRDIKQGYRLGKIDMREELKDLHAMIITFINKGLPTHNIARSQVTPIMTALKNSKSIEDVQKVMDRVDAVFESVTAKEKKEKVKKLLDKYKPRERNKIPFGSTLTADQYRTLDEIQTVVGMSRDQAESEIATVSETATRENREYTPEETKRVNILTTYAGLKAMTAKEVDKVIAGLEYIIDEGRMEHQIKEEARRFNDKANVKKIVKVLTGGKGVMTEEAFNATRKDKNRSVISNTNMENQSLETQLDILSSLDKGSEQFESDLNKIIMPIVHDAGNTEKRGLAKQFTLLTDKAKEIFGEDDTGKLLKVLNKNSEQVDAGITLTQGEEGAEVDVPLWMSQNDAYKYWQAYQDPSLASTFERMGYTADVMHKIEGFLTPEVKAWAEWQLNDFYPKYYESVNDVFNERFFVDLPFNPFYTPIFRDVKGKTADDQLLQDMNTRASATNGHLKSRTSNTERLMQMDGDTVLAQHIIQMEHFKAYAEASRTLRSLLENKEVITAIRQYHGNRAVSVLKKSVDDIIRGGVDRQLINKGLDKFRANFSKAVIALNPTVFAKQLASIPAFAMDIPTKDFLVGMGDFWMHPEKNFKTLMGSDFMKARYSRGYDRDVVLGHLRSSSKRIAGAKNFTDKLMAPAKLGDATAIVLGGWSVYKYHYDAAIKDGSSETEAKDKAMKQFVAASKRSQQSSDTEDLADWMRQGSVMKAMTMFMTSKNSYYRLEAAALRNLINGRGSKKAALKRIFITHFVLPTIFQFIANGFRWDKEDQIRANLLGSFGGVLIWGSMAEGIISKGLGKDRYFDHDFSPLFSTGEDIVRFGGEILGDILSGDIIDAWASLSDEALSISSKVAGVPYDPFMRIAGGIKDFATGKTKNVLRPLGWSKYSLDEKSKKKNLLLEKYGTNKNRGSALERYGK